VTPSRQVSDGEAATPTRRVSLKDVLALLLFAGWCTLGIVKIAHDVAEYRAQQAAVAAFDAPPPNPVSAATETTTGTAVAAAPYDPALGKWLIGEAVGYALTLAVVFAGLSRARRRKTTADVGTADAKTADVKWIAPTRQAAASVAAWTDRRTAARGSPSGAIAAERLAAVVWHDRVARLEKERA
jgi:hypothetical protein